MSATAWIYGYIDTDVPGYRKVSIGGSVRTAAAGYYRFDAYLGAITSATASDGFGMAVNSSGGCTLTKPMGSAAAVVWTDRLGWLCGMRADPGDSEGSVNTVTARMPSPACIPLLGATWDEVEIHKQREFKIDRQLRGHGFVFGGARLWTWRLTMDKDSLEALRTGWCLRGKIVISGKDPTQLHTDSAWSSSNTDGFLECRPVGIQRTRWLDVGHTIAEVELLVTTQGP